MVPLSIIKKVGELEIKPSQMTLQLADRSIKYTHGVVEDVLVKVDKFLFLIDFVIMDMKEDVEVPLILGRSFMKTTKVLIDVDYGKLTMRVQDEEVNFNVFEAMSHPKDVEGCFRVDMLDEVLMSSKKVLYTSSCLEKAPIDAFKTLNDEEEKEIDECLANLDALKEIPSHEVNIEDLNIENEVKEAKVELKMLPPHLKYVFLEGDNNNLVINNNSLSPLE